MRAVKVFLAGRESYLAFTGEAMFRINDEFGGSAELLDRMQEGTRDGLAVITRTAVILAESGELARRHMGYDPAPMPDGDAIAATITPEEIVRLKHAVTAAIALGYGREVKDEDEVVDLGLLELEAQKKTN